MIDLREAVLTKLVINRFDPEPGRSLSGENLVTFTSDEEVELRRMLLKPFEAQTITHEFSHAVNLDYNVLYGVIRNEYSEQKFVDCSKQIMNHLNDVSDHPNIKGGDVFVARFEEIKIYNTYYEAVGIFKFEDKQTYVETGAENGAPTMELRKGIGNRKPEKACLVILAEEPYTILIIDNGKAGDTEYWQDDFIMHQLKSDNANHTNNFLNMTRAFIVDELPNEFEIGRADQIDMLNKSVDYFKTHEAFDLREFENDVIGQPEVLESFDKYKTKFQTETDTEVSEDFMISKPVLKKQARAFKSVLKLDKNFHVYIHGDRKLIEQGIDENGKKFYKIFYEVEY